MARSLADKQLSARNGDGSKHVSMTSHRQRLPMARTHPKADLIHQPQLHGIACGQPLVGQVEGCRSPIADGGQERLREPEERTDTFGQAGVLEG